MRRIENGVRGGAVQGGQGNGAPKSDTKSSQVNKWVKTTKD